MYNGSDSNTSAHTRFAKPLETRRTSHYPETYSIIYYLSPTWSVKPWNLSLTVSSRGNAPPTTLLTVTLSAMSVALPPHSRRRTTDRQARPLLPCSSASAPSRKRPREPRPGSPQGGRCGASGAAALVGVALGCPSAPAPWSAETRFLRG